MPGCPPPNVREPRQPAPQAAQHLPGLGWAQAPLGMMTEGASTAHEARDMFMSIKLIPSCCFYASVRRESEVLVALVGMRPSCVGSHFKSIPAIRIRNSRAAVSDDNTPHISGCQSSQHTF